MDRRRLLVCVWRVAIVVLILERLVRTFLGEGFLLFDYFTNDSNLVAAGVLLWACGDWRSEHPVTSWLRGAAVLYLAITAVVDQLILHGGLQGVELHIVAPIAVLIDWLLLPPRTPVGGRSSLLWIAFPLVYLGAVLVYGALSGQYPYGFLNPNVGGRAEVALYVAVIALVVLLLARLVRLSSNRPLTAV